MDSSFLSANSLLVAQRYPLFVRVAYIQSVSVFHLVSLDFTHARLFDEYLHIVPEEV